MEAIVRWTNRLTIFAGIVLVYLVFALLVMGVFGLTVFRENSMEAFIAAIPGLVALMAGTVVVNVSLNLTRIANAVEGRAHRPPARFGTMRTWIIAGVLLAVFPLILGGLYAGDLATKKKRETRIVATAQEAIADYESVIHKIAQTEFTRSSINQATRNIRLLEGMEKNFPRVEVVFYGVLPGTDREVFWDLSGYAEYDSDKETDKDLWGVDYIRSVSPDERVYLKSVFAGETTDYRFSAHDRQYELYYPVVVDERVVVLYLSDYQRYGKIGS
jgi:hypothetical protein